MRPHLHVVRALFIVAFSGACGGAVTDPSDDGPEAGRGGTGGRGGSGGGGGNPSMPPWSVPPRTDGVMACPTVEAPAYVNASGVSSLSGPFNELCTVCHGAQGRGLGNIPGLPGSLSFEDYLAVVRGGRAGMPAFDAKVVSDETLRADYEALQGKGTSPVPWGSEKKPPSDWSEAEVNGKIAAGLAVWRKPDSHGAACANCHSPDGIELAAIGYSNADVARRSLLHLSPDDTVAIIDLVHAQRRKYGIVKPCDPMAWRPMQPGGTPLRGRGAEVELAFGQQLYDLGLPVTKKRVSSLDDAVAARDAWLAVNPRLIRTSIAFSRWSEDRFHGPQHSSLNDWMTSVPWTPADGQATAWYGLHDAYLADPSDDNLMAILRAREKTLRVPDELVHSPSKFIFEGKYEAALIAQHLMREELRGGPGFLGRGPVIFANVKDAAGNYGGAPNPFWVTGYYANGNSVPHCNGNFGGEVPNCMRLPMEAVAELLPGQAGSDAMGAFGHSWMMMGWYFDPGMMASVGGNFNHYRGKYWELPGTFESFFVSHMRLMYQVLLGGDGQAASILGYKATRPMLNGFQLHQSHMPTGVGDYGKDTDRVKKLFVPVAANTYRMWAYLLRGELEAGRAVANKTDLVSQLTQWRDFNVKYDDATDSKALFDGVIALVQKATEVKE